MTYFVVSVQIDEEKGIGSYEDYIRQVKPLVELHGGKYLVRSEKIQYLGNVWKPDRLIIICFPSRKELDACFQSVAYQEIADKRRAWVDAQAVIIEEEIYGDL